MNVDGSISGDEYLKLAHERHEARKRRQALEPDLAASHTRPERQINKDDPLLAAMLRAVTDKKQKRPYQSRLLDGTPCADCSDIVIREPQRLPQRQQFMRLGSCPDNISPPMMEQLASDKYPTLADHQSGRSPAYTFTIDDLGQFVYYRLEEVNGKLTRVGDPL